MERKGYDIKTADRRGVINKCFWQEEKTRNGRTKIKKDAFLYLSVG